MSDGCAAQYKCKKAFKNISNGLCGVPVQWSYFGPGHGKGPADATSGVVKQSAYNAVKGRKAVIRNCEDLYQYCQNHMAINGESCHNESHVIRKFFLVDEVQGSGTCESMKQIEGSRGFFCLRSTGTNGTVDFRNRTCYCKSCLGDGNNCENLDFVENWEKVELEKGRKKRKKKVTPAKRRAKKPKCKPVKRPRSTRKERTIHKEKVQRKRNADQSKDDDLSLADVRKITRNLIHSPYTHQLQVCKSLNLKPLTACAQYDVIKMNPDVDEFSEKMLDNVHLPGTIKFPCHISGDGNCLPRVGSVLAFGTEARHAEMRLRICHEMMLFQHVYMSDDFISRGWPENLIPIPSVDGYMDLCSNYYAKKNLTTVEKYNKEVNDVLKSGDYMGMLQLFALASVLGCPLVSVYPNRGDITAQRELHRLIMPREMRSRSIKFVMWTRCAEIDKNSVWYPNHFVTLLPFNGVEEATLEDCSLL